MAVSFNNLLVSTSFFTRFVLKVLPQVAKDENGWRCFASLHTCPELAAQALDSIRKNKFHCQESSLYSLYRGVHTRSFIRFAVALQTISGYLDTLCSQAAKETEEQSFRQLHLAVTDALDPSVSLHDYYRFYRFKEDGGYLARLVTVCRQEIGRLPSYDKVRAEILRQAKLYCDLQIYKRLDPAVRERHIQARIAPYQKHYPALSPGELVAAARSLLGVLMLCAAASDPYLPHPAAARITTAYFPWINGLQALLDQLINGANDRKNGDRNGSAHGPDPVEIKERLLFFRGQAFAHAQMVPAPVFTATVVRSLLAMYLSDPRADLPDNHPVKTALLAQSGSLTHFLHEFCRMLRRQKILH